MARVILSALPAERPCRLLAEPWPVRGTYQTKGPWSVAFSPDGRLLIANSYSGARLYDAATGSEVAFLPTGNGVGLAARREDLWIAASDSAGSGDLRGELWRWPWKTSEGEITLGPPTKIADGQPVHHFAASADGAQLAWTLGHFGGPLFLARASAPPQRVPSVALRHLVALSPDGATLAAACPTHAIQLWDLRTLRRTLSPLGLDWPGAALPEPKAHTPVRVRIQP